MIQIKDLIRSKENVLPKLKSINNQTITLEDTKVCFPITYESGGLAEIGNTNTVCGIFPIIMNNYYTVLSVNAMVKLEPDEINVIDIEGTGYYEFCFDAGSVLIADNDIVVQDLVPYYVYNQFISNGRVPWYMEYEDMCTIFDTASTYSGANLGKHPEDIHLMISIMGRKSDDLREFYRQTVTDKKDPKQKASFIALKSVSHGSSSTLNKLAGNYFNTGVISALIDPSEEATIIERVLRK